jgi:hypothetical protein
MNIGMRSIGGGEKERKERREGRRIDQKNRR